MSTERYDELATPDRRRRVMDQIESLLLEGLASGSATEVIPESWRKKMRDFWRKHKPSPAKQRHP